MRLEQAIFTSVRSERLDGYQLAARSLGISDELAKELNVWGPAHDSLWLATPGASSLNFHPLAGERYCISQTTLSGAEYSGRGGGRVYTQMVILPYEALNRFGGDPFLVWRALNAAGRLIVFEQVARELPTISLVGRAGDALPACISDIVAKAGAETIAQLVEAVAGETPVTVVTDLPVERLFQAVLQQFEPAERLSISFTTGLKPSSRRPFKLSIVPDDPSLMRQSQRMHHGRVIEVLACDTPASSRQRLTAVRSR